VSAHLGADGKLVVTETQAMVFSGDWKRRRARVRRPSPSAVRLSRVFAGSRRPAFIALREDALISRVDEYAWTGTNTLAMAESDGS
jgi:hypothetical protein